MSASSLLAVVVIALAVVMIVRRVEVRLVMVLAGLPLFVVTNTLPVFLTRMVAELTNAGTVVPICSAMGFAYVLRETQCDQHLVNLLVRPLHRVRMLLIPGGIAVGYLVNTAIVSQTGTAAVVGPILIPLLCAAGIRPATAGALLLVGSSMGGELFNPSAVEIRTLAGLTHLATATIVARSARLNLLACGTALLAFWWRAARSETLTKEASAPQAGEAPFRLSLIKALIPLLPLALLFAAMAAPSGALPSVLTGPARILAAMLIGCVAAGLTAPGLASKLTMSFFEGAGYAYTHVISLIVAATLFAEAIKQSGLIQWLTSTLLHWPPATLLAAATLPWLLAVVTGTGIGAAVAVINFLVPVAGELGLDPVRVGAIAAMGAHFGRTMSPVAAVVMMCAKLSGSEPMELVARVAPPLIVGGVALFVAALVGVV